MATPEPGPQDLDSLVIDVAGDLMGVGINEAEAATRKALARIRAFFGVDLVFLRRFDFERWLTVLVAEEPAREDVPDPDPLAEISLDDPAAMGSHERTEPFIIYPETSTEYDELVQSATDLNAVTVAQVPLLRGTQAIGGLGIIHFGMRPWEDREISAITAIATMFAQLWGRTEAETTLVYLAYNDELTTLPNRTFLMEHLDGLSGGLQVALMVIDIDNMKVINDGLDFEAGNAFLVGLAERLRAIVRPEDLVVRLQGDQFAVLLHDAAPRHTERIATRFVRELSESVDVNGSSIARSVSIGVASTTIRDGTGSLLAEAAAALNTAKSQGKRRAVLFDESMRSRTLENYELEIELRRALDEQELCLHYQPEFDLESGRLVATEALLRWQHPARGLISAGLFIEVAEESGLVVEIGDFVLDEAIRQLGQWHPDHPELEMWINVSPAQLMSRDLVAQVAESLARHEVPADRICLELTEHAVLGDIDYTSGALRGLREMGVKLALDDFGTGYSSMKQLKNLPINTLKIDMSFVAGLGVSDYDTAIVDAAITLAGAFGLKTVAEGIEDPDQLEELRRRGCTTGQGYYLARPAAPDDVEPHLGRVFPVGEARRHMTSSFDGG